MDEQFGERVRTAYVEGPEAVMAVVGEMLGAVMVHLSALTARVAELEAENAALRAQRALTSKNSSHPPSSDGPQVPPRTKSQRSVQGRTPGGQPGHPGRTLLLCAVPDQIVRHAPAACAQCAHALTGLSSRLSERRQVIDLPPLRAQVLEHQAHTVICPRCGAHNRGHFPCAVQAPVQYGPGLAALAVYLSQDHLIPLARTCTILAEVFAAPLAEGTVQQAIATAHTHLEAVERAIKTAVTAAPVLHVDETGVRLGRQTAWLHVASTAALTFYAVDPQRGTAAMEAIGVLPVYRGWAVHDGWASYRRYTACHHALCNAHHLRELTFVDEERGQGWARDLTALLIEMKEETDLARLQGQEAVAPQTVAWLHERYATLIAAAQQANPPPVTTGARGRPPRGKVGSLVERLDTHRTAVLAFLSHLAVPFDNNQAERDLRMTKVREKISGCFRTPQGAQRFCRIRGYISTLRKQGRPILASLRQAVEGYPPLPAMA